MVRASTIALRKDVGMKALCRAAVGAEVYIGDTGMGILYISIGGEDMGWDRICGTRSLVYQLA